MNITIRDFKQEDKKQTQEIFSMYWTDPEFLAELSNELEQYIDNKYGNYGFVVADNDNEIVGIVGYKKIPDYLKEFSRTKNPVELYVIASKYQRQGIGEQLKSKIIERAKDAKFTEILLFSPNTHSESWPFHDTFGFERLGEVVPPEDEIGQVWGKIL